MIYFTTKKEMPILAEFEDLIQHLWNHEDKALEHLNNYFELPTTQKRQAASYASTNIPGYADIRNRIASIVDDVLNAAERHGLGTIVQSYPAPVVGGPVLPVNIFLSVLNDNSHGGIERSLIMDTLHRLQSGCRADLRKEFRQLVNPIYWMKELIIFVIRLPFLLFSLSGFSISKIEDHFLSKVFKVAEIMILIYLAVRIGVDKLQLGDILRNLFR